MRCCLGMPGPRPSAHAVLIRNSTSTAASSVSSRHPAVRTAWGGALWVPLPVPGAAASDSIRIRRFSGQPVPSFGPGPELGVPHFLPPRHVQSALCNTRPLAVPDAFCVLFDSSEGSLLYAIRQRLVGKGCCLLCLLPI